MKVKTSITISQGILSQLDKALDRQGNRSAFIEEAIKHHLLRLARERRDQRDIQILNEQADQLNAEATDVLGYQAEL